MKILLTILFLSLLSSSCSKPSEDLLVRDGLYYKKFSEVPFSGKVTGFRKGSMKNGKAEGEWVAYFSNGQIMSEGSIKNGKKEGAWIRYHDNGQIMFKVNYKNGLLHGEYLRFSIAGQLYAKQYYKYGAMISD